jgi:hypothetical protein
VSATRLSAARLGIWGCLLVAGTALWGLHARSWDLGRGSPVLSYDAAEYALAARELAEHGRLATTFALPLELSRHAQPPWPLALVQPGLVAAEAVLFRLAASFSGAEAAHPAALASADPREWLVLVLPFACFLATGLALSIAGARILERHAPGLPAPGPTAAGVVLGLAFLLDPEAQHFAVGGFTELPFTLGMMVALLAIALELAPRRPLLFGLLLGVTGAFRGNMLWLAPILAGAAASLDPPPRRLAVFARVMLGYALPLIPWWFYKWRAFGSPAWDLSWLSLWDGVGGRTWFSLNHLPELPDLPAGLAAAGAIARKVVGNLPRVLLELSRGPRALWLGALLIWVSVTRPPRALAAAALAVLGVTVVSALVAAATVPQARYLFAARVAAEATGVLALWGLVSRLPPGWLSLRGSRALRGLVAALALGWGAWQTARGAAEARAAALDRGVPSTQSMIDLARRLDREVPPGEPVMSNLGSVLAWYARRPVVHLALSPADIAACRRELDVRHVLLVFREPARAWPAWVEVMARPAEVARDPELNVARVERFDTRDGFMAVWLDLGPLAPRMARNPATSDYGRASAPGN